MTRQTRKKAAAALTAAAGKTPDVTEVASAVHFSQGMVAAAKKDMATARSHFAKCSDEDMFCHWQAFEVSQKHGDRAGAAAAHGRLTKIYRRDPLVLYARTRIERAVAKPKRTT